MPMLDGWTDVFAGPGQAHHRHQGRRPTRSPARGWKGTLPAGVKELKSPTDMVWILGRTYCTGTPEDYEAVHALQDQYKLVPLSAYGKPYTPPAGKVDPSIDMKTPVREQVNALDAAAYFTLLAELMKDNPPAKADAPMVAKLAKLGIVPGEDFDLGKLDPAVRQGARRGPEGRRSRRSWADFKKAGTEVNGWVFTTQTGIYGTDYLQRALITAIGLGANRPQDAVYPTSEVDADGKPYERRQQVRHALRQGRRLPPVNGFWSLTMYDAEYFFVDNPLNRYTVSPRTR